MPLARREFTVVDSKGNIVTDAQVEVRREIAGAPLAVLYEDRDGNSLLGNPFNVDPTTAVAAFHVAGGAYRIRAFKAGFERIERYVAIGTAAETDAGTIVTAIQPSAWAFDDSTSDSDPGSGKFRLNNANPASATAAYIDNLNAGGVDVSAWLNTLDDNGDTDSRGVLTIFNPDAATEDFRAYTVSGSVVDGSGYRKLTLTHIAGAGSFAADGKYAFSFASHGPLHAQEAAQAAQAAAEAAQAAAETAETNAETAETNAEAAQAAAESAASTATTQAGIATTQAGIATTAAGNAATAETNAETAQAAAELAQAAAEAAQAAAEAASENPALLYDFDAATTDADPGNGEFRLNHATPASATFAYFDNLDRDGNTVTGWLDFFDDSTNSSSKGLLILRDVSDETAMAVYRVTGSVVDGTGYRKVPITHVASGAGTFSGPVSVLFVPAGDELSAALILAALLTVDGAGSGLDADLLDGQSSAFYATASSVSDHLGDTSDAHDASAISFSPAGDIAATDVQAAIEELDSEKVPTSRSLTAGNGLTGGGDLSANRTFDVGAGTGIVANANDVAVDKASDANVRAAASNKVLTSDLIESASAGVAITNQTPATWDWDAGINFTLTISQNTQIATPSNGQPGTWRTILVQGNNTTDRTITFSGDYEGDIPTITDCDNGRWYLLMIYCVTSSHFVVSSKKANGT
jgi:hypothetical protein